MRYDNIKKAKFILRPNRFIAHIEINGKVEICHVKNTGRCKELLTPNATVFVQEHDNPNRKTKYSLINVIKEVRLINMDSQVPNKIVQEWIEAGNLIKGVTLIKPERKYNNSRFDFYVETTKRKIFIEVKGVTLENDRVAMFPDAPTDRGVKHIKELCECTKEGYEAYIIFVIQMDNIIHFEPNTKMHKEFSEALKKARKQGVNILAVDCDVKENSINIKDYVEVVI